MNHTTNAPKKCSIASLQNSVKIIWSSSWGANSKFSTKRLWSGLVLVRNTTGKNMSMKSVDEMFKTVMSCNKVWYCLVIL